MRIVSAIVRCATRKHVSLAGYPLQLTVHYRTIFQNGGALGAGAVRRFTETPSEGVGVYGQRHRAHDDLLLHPGVGMVHFRDGIMYVAGVSKSELRFLSARVDEAALRKYLQVDLGYAADEVPTMKVVDTLPEEVEGQCPFMLHDILEALFHSLDTDGNGTITLAEFESFCHEYGLFAGRDSELRSAFREADHHRFKFLGRGRLDISEFKELMLDSGLVEVRFGEEARVGGAYLIEEHIIDVVLKVWFARYDNDGDGTLNFKEYCRLVTDYQLPHAVSREGFQSVDADSNGTIDIREFKKLLTNAKILSVGDAISLKEDRDGVRKAWRAIEASQQFLPSGRVHSPAVDLPPKAANSIRFVCISDTHGHHEDLKGKLPDGDVLLHAGDFTMSGETRELVSFGSWLESLPYEMKIIIGGNHDVTLDAEYEMHEHPSIVDAAIAALLSAAGPSVKLLQDEVVVFRGVRIYGSPWQPAFGRWAFGLRRGEPLSNKWRMIPDNVDVLLVHGPPMGRGDLTGNVHVGCSDLLHEIQNRVRPTFCVSGHIHDTSSSFDGFTHYINASSCDGNYECVYPPLVFDVMGF